MALRAPWRCRPLWGVVLLAVVGPAAAHAHWMRPEEIVAGLASDAQLRERLGVVAVQIEPRLPRLLIIKVDRTRWEAAPAETRTKLAEEWLETWRHNVPEGIVAVLDATTEQSVVNFDGLGHARLRALAPTPSPQPARHAPG